jgi:hypothetical protein
VGGTWLFSERKLLVKRIEVRTRPPALVVAFQRLRAVPMLCRTNAPATAGIPTPSEPTVDARLTATFGGAIKSTTPTPDRDQPTEPHQSASQPARRDIARERLGIRDGERAAALGD